MYKFVSLPLESPTPEKQTGNPHLKYSVTSGECTTPLTKDEHRWLASMLLGKIITKERVNSGVKFVLDGEFISSSFITRFMGDMIIEEDSLRIKKPAKFSIVFI